MMMRDIPRVIYPEGGKYKPIRREILIFQGGTSSSYQTQGVVTPIRTILTDATGVTMWSRGHRRIFGVGTGSRKIFSTVAWCHGAVLCRGKSKNFTHVHPMVPQVPSSLVAHALLMSIPY